MFWGELLGISIGKGFRAVMRSRDDSFGVDRHARIDCGRATYS